MIYAVPFILIQVALLVCWWSVWLFSGHMSPFMRNLFIFVSALLLCLWIVRSYYHYKHYATVIAQNAPLYVGPEKGYPKRGFLQQQEGVVVEQKKDGWYYVSSSQGRGWLQADDVSIKEST